jgi:dTDP-4-dehydrorhamnose reductase
MDAERRPPKVSSAMRVLILGGTGMLGHKLYQTFVPHFDTYVTFRRRPEPHWTIFDNAHVLNGVAAEDFDTVVRAFETARAQVVVNCVGIIKQSPTAKDSVTTITVNSLLPHRLARLCLDGGARLIQLSTDCIFSGRKGNYSETATPDAEDLYGRSKLLGEVEGSNCLTLRTSMIGRELERSDGLLEWFLSQNGKTVRGFTRAIFSGFTTNALANIIAQIVTSHPGLMV